MIDLKLMNTRLFTARLVPGSESHPADERLYEVVTATGERIASTTQEAGAELLAARLNQAARHWAQYVAVDAVLG